MTASRAARLALAGLAASVIGSLGTAVVYWRGGQTQMEGLGIGVALLGIAVALVAWANAVMPAEEVVGEREPLAGPVAPRRALEREVHDPEITRRSALRRGLAVALGALGAASVFPLRSLGPSPGRSLLDTPWRSGLRLVTSDGRPVHAAAVPSDGLVTVFPEGAAGSADGQTVLIRTAVERLRPRPGRESWTPDGLVAYSKLCTHAGCPVGLYQAESHQLLCPCHQSVFDVLDGARPVSGPAAASLPQLPLAVDGEGYIVATGGFSGPVGPAFWESDG